MGVTLLPARSRCAPSCSRSATTRRRASARRWMLAAWAAMALRGAVQGPDRPGAARRALVLYIAARSATGACWRRLHLRRRACALFLAIAAPWFVAVSLRQSRVPALLLHPRALRALPHQGARPLPAAVVLRSGAARGRAALDAVACSTRSGARRAARSRAALPAAALPAGLVRRGLRVLLASPAPSCRPTSCRCSRRWRC